MKTKGRGDGGKMAPLTWCNMVRHNPLPAIGLAEADCAEREGFAGTSHCRAAQLICRQSDQALFKQLIHVCVTPQILDMTKVRCLISVLFGRLSQHRSPATIANYPTVIDYHSRQLPEGTTL